MIFVINNLKYDTDKMELVSDNISYFYEWEFKLSITREKILSAGKDVKLFRSKKNRWLITYKTSCEVICGKSLEEETVKELLLKYDLEKYEELFGELEEA